MNQIKTTPVKHSGQYMYRQIYRQKLCTLSLHFLLFSSSFSQEIAITSLPTIECNRAVFFVRYVNCPTNPAAWNFLSHKPEVTWRTVAIIIRVVLHSPYLCIRCFSLSSIHYSYNHSRRVYINRRPIYLLNLKLKHELKFINFPRLASWAQRMYVAKWRLMDAAGGSQAR